MSEGEYWNAAESSNPLTDPACDATPVVAVAGATAAADLTFNGFDDGIEFTPIVSAFLTSLSTDGSRAGGTAGSGSIALRWDADTGIEVLPDGMGSNNGTIDGPGTRMAIQHDPDGNGIAEPAIWNENGFIRYLGDLNGDTCGGGSEAGQNSAVAWSMDRSASKVVGMAYVDLDSSGNCEGSGEVIPFIWDEDGGMREMDYDVSMPWTRAHAISGNGRVVLGVSNFEKAWAWVDESGPIDLTVLTGATDANAINFDGSVVAVNGVDTTTFRNTGILLWNAWLGTGTEAFTNVDSLRYCVDVPLMGFFGDNQCEFLTPEEAYDAVGVVPISVFGVNDAGTVLVGRAGSFFTGLYGAIWVKDIGWMVMTDFLERQGVIEASNVPIDNPLAISAVWDSNAGSAAWSSGAVDNTTGPDRVTSFSQRSTTLTDIFAPGAYMVGVRMAARVMSLVAAGPVVPVALAVLVRGASSEMRRRMAASVESTIPRERSALTMESVVMPAPGPPLPPGSAWSSNDSG